MSTTIKQAINDFLLSCKVEGKSYGTIECYTDKLKGFLWYARNYGWPDDINSITTPSYQAESLSPYWLRRYLGHLGS